MKKQLMNMSPEGEELRLLMENVIRFLLASGKISMDQTIELWKLDNTELQQLLKEYLK